MATHSSIPAWRFPWTEEPGGLQSMGLQRVEHRVITTYYKVFIYMKHFIFTIQSRKERGPVLNLSQNNFY